jgi:hypothetical protein
MLYYSYRLHNSWHIPHVSLHYMFRAIKYNKDTSTYAQHILNTGHSYGNIQHTMEIIQVTQKGSYMNNLEKYHTYCAHQQGIQVNEVLFDLKILYSIPSIITTQNNTHTITLPHQQHHTCTHRHVLVYNIHTIQTNTNSTSPTQPLQQHSKTQGKQNTGK